QAATERAAAAAANSAKRDGRFIPPAYADSYRRSQAIVAKTSARPIARATSLPVDVGLCCGFASPGAAGAGAGAGAGASGFALAAAAIERSVGSFCAGAAGRAGVVTEARSARVGGGSSEAAFGTASASSLDGGSSGNVGRPPPALAETIAS